jgi:hypothetical protein
MKRVLLVAAALVAYAANAQDTTTAVVKDTTWKTSGFFGVNTSQTALSDWQGGGNNNVSVGAIFNIEVVYQRDKYEQWLTKADAQFGTVKQDPKQGFRKNIDQIFLLTKYNSLAFGTKWFWSAQADYRTQFAPGYNYNQDQSMMRAMSDFNSPAYIQLALGIDYKPTNYFSFNVAPIAGKITTVNRQHLADEGAYGVEKATIDENGNIVTPGKKIRYEVGGRIIMKFKKDIMTNVNLDSYLDLFTNYLVKPGNFDVVFNNLLTIKINKIITFNVISQMIYDDDIKRKRDLNGDNLYDGEGEINGPRLQLLTTVAIGFGYKF